MKQTKLYSCLLMLVMLLTASVAMAQELTVKTVTFVKAGEKATIAVGLKNSDIVDNIQARIALPEGLTFVAEENNEKAFVGKETKRSKDVAYSFYRASDNVGVAFGMGEIKAGEGDVFTFDVNVAADFSTAALIEFTKIELCKPDGSIVKTDPITAKVENEENKVLIAGTCPDIKVSTAEKTSPVKVSFTVDFDKAVLNAASFFVTLPQGLTVVDGSAEVGSLCPNHEAAYVNGVYTILVKNFMKDASFADKKGELGSFEVVADETFVDGSEIKISNIRTTSGMGKDLKEYLAEDFAIKVKKEVTSGINGITAEGLGADGIYQMNGVRTDRMKQGVNIIVKGGKAVKVVKK